MWLHRYREAGPLGDAGGYAYEGDADPDGRNEVLESGYALELPLMDSSVTVTVGEVKKVRIEWSLG